MGCFCLILLSLTTAFSLPCEFVSKDTARLFDDSPLYDLRPGLTFSGRVTVEALRERGYQYVVGHGLITDPGMFLLRIDPANEGGHMSFFVNLGDGPGPRVISPEPVKPGQTYDVAAGWDGKEIWLTVDGKTHRRPRPGKISGVLKRPLQLGPMLGRVSDLKVQVPEPSSSFDATLGTDFRFSFDATFNSPIAEDTSLLYKNGEYMLRYIDRGDKRYFRFFIYLRGNWEPSLDVPFDIEPGHAYRIAGSWDGAVSKLTIDGATAEAKRYGVPVVTANPLHIGDPGKVTIDCFALSSPKLPHPTFGNFHAREEMPRIGEPFTFVGEVGNRGAAIFSGGEVEFSAVEDGVRIEPTKIRIGSVEPFSRKPFSCKVTPGAHKAVTMVATFKPAAFPAVEKRKRIVLMPAKDPSALLAKKRFPLQPTRTWYVDARAGDDARDGLSEATAWKTFAPVNGKTLGPGERLLLKRGSVFNEELKVTAKASSSNWALIGAYGEGPRPQIRRNRHIDERCAYILDPKCLMVRDLVVANAGQGLEIDCDAPGTGGVLVENCLAHHIEGSYAFNSHGIPEWFDHLGAPRKGHPSTYRSFGISLVGRHARNFIFRDCETYQCSAGFSLAGENAYAGRIFCHDNYAHNTSPHPGIYPTSRAWLVDSVFDASGWHASNGTMGLFLACNDGLVIRNCHFLNQPDSGSPDEGGIDFEAGGDNYLVDHCTFRNNAGPAIEVLGFMITQAHNIHIRNSRFDRNNHKRKLGPTEIFISGGDGNHDVWCSTGSVLSNGYSLVDGVGFYTNREESTWKDWVVADNKAYASSAELSKAMPFNEPPQIELPDELWIDAGRVTLKAKVTEDALPQKGALRVAWEQLEGPALARFLSPTATETVIEFPAPGDYRLLFRADDGELWRSARTVVHVRPSGERSVRAWTFARNLDCEGWKAKGLNIEPIEYPAGKWYRSTPTPVDPVNLVCGDYWVMAMEKADKAVITLEEGLALPLKPNLFVEVRMMNHTSSEKMRLCWSTVEDGAWKSKAFEVKPHDVDDSVYRIPLPASGTLDKLALAFSVAGTPVTGTVRIDYINLGEVKK